LKAVKGKDESLTTIFVVGATGMTGCSLVEQLLDNGHTVRVVVRSPGKFSTAVRNNPNLTVLGAGILDLTNEEIATQVKNCGTVISCLGHVLDFKGMFGSPRRLCTDATRRLCTAIEKNNELTDIFGDGVVRRRFGYGDFAVRHRH
jgi:NAD dependent epimerase/dehydratase family enzyme